MRYLPLTDPDRTDMLAAIGAPSIDALFDSVPPDVLLAEPVDLPPHQGELSVERTLSRLAAKNTAAGSVPFFCGAGAYRHHVPATVDHLIQRSEFLTSYTPYQPEITQGTLQAVFEFQTQVAALTGMDVANASMYDGSTAAAEAVLMAARVTRRAKAVLSPGLHPHYADTIYTLAHHAGIKTDPLPLAVDDEAAVLSHLDADTACVVVQTPNLFGTATDVSAIAEAAHAAGALLIVVVTEAVSLGLLKSPGEMGADIVVGEGQSIGNGLNYGGPYVGLFATRDKYVRQMPGRVCGQTVDAAGKPRFRAHPVHPRAAHPSRQGDLEYLHQLRALCAGVHHPHEPARPGRTATSRQAEPPAGTQAQGCGGRRIAGVEVLTPRFFNEIAVRLPMAAGPLVDRLAARGVIAGVPVSRLAPGAGMEDVLLLAATETTPTKTSQRLPPR